MMRRLMWIPLGLAGLALCAVWVAADERKGPRAFETAEAAARAAIEAARTNDDDALRALLGPKCDDLVQRGGDPLVARERATFARLADERLVLEAQPDGSRLLVVGRHGWPLPIPIAQVGKRWQFDAAAGREEMLARIVGENELNAIELCRLYARAQVAYARKDRDGDKVREYAQRLNSSDGKQDGLYWEAAPGDETSPIGPLIESARPYLKDRKAGDPFGGYYWLILNRQGTHAPGGRHGYVINGNMIAGFALVGFPAAYDRTGVMTFLVSHHGEILQKDLGPKTRARVQAMEGFDPDPSWDVVVRRSR